MLNITIDPSNRNVIKINGETYIKVSNSADMPFEKYDFEADKDLWVFKSASEIYFDCYGKQPKGKSEVTAFTVNVIANSGFERKKKACGRGYIVPPIK